jgi:hypothetical protein
MASLTAPDCPKLSAIRRIVSKSVWSVIPTSLIEAQNRGIVFSRAIRVHQPGPGDVIGMISGGCATEPCSGLVLDDHGGAGCAKRFATFQAILSLAGQSHAQGICAVDSGDRPEEHIHRRAAKILPRPLVRAQSHALFILLHDHMIVTRRDPNAGRAKQITRLALPHGQGALGCKTLGQEHRENGWHALRDAFAKNKRASPPTGTPFVVSTQPERTDQPGCGKIESRSKPSPQAE